MHAFNVWRVNYLAKKTVNTYLRNNYYYINVTYKSIPGGEIGSVVYTVPDTLLTRREGSNVNVYGEYEDNDKDEDDIENVNEPLRLANDHVL